MEGSRGTGVGGIDICQGRGVEIMGWRCGSLEGIRGIRGGVIDIFLGRGVESRSWRCGSC